MTDQARTPFTTGKPPVFVVSAEQYSTTGFWLHYGKIVTKGTGFSTAFLIGEKLTSRREIINVKP